MSDKSKAKQMQRVVTKLLPEINADRKGQDVMLGNIVACIKILNNLIPEKSWRFTQRTGVNILEPVDDKRGGTA